MLLLYYRENFPARILPPAWAGPKTAEEAKQMFYTSLERTGAGYFDFYLLHNCGDTRTDAFYRHISNTNCTVPLPFSSHPVWAIMKIV